MRWPPQSTLKFGTRIEKVRFAWWPVRLTDGWTVWWERYVEVYEVEADGQWTSTGPGDYEKWSVLPGTEYLKLVEVKKYTEGGPPTNEDLRCWLMQKAEPATSHAADAEKYVAVRERMASLEAECLAARRLIKTPHNSHRDGRAYQKLLGEWKACVEATDDAHGKRGAR